MTNPVLPSGWSWTTHDGSLAAFWPATARYANPGDGIYVYGRRGSLCIAESPGSPCGDPSGTYISVPDAVVDAVRLASSSLAVGPQTRVSVIATHDVRAKMLRAVEHHKWSIHEACRMPYTYEEDFVAHPFDGFIPESDGPVTLTVSDYVTSGICELGPAVLLEYAAPAKVDPA
jgi:hypothetical protein